MADGRGLSTEPIPNFYGQPIRGAAENSNRINELPGNTAELGPSIDSDGRRRVSRVWRGAVSKYHIAVVR